MHRERAPLMIISGRLLTSWLVLVAVVRQQPLTMECNRAVYARIGLADLSAARSVGRPGRQAWRSSLLPQH